ncbi:MAG TPA: TlpA disulfide reductase family protein [Bacteroidia bacterium]|jgi:thiol-disulfide isomerase/thioredoxin|nr:TlpA disulfide reductase family protein [Bacteroidia bacterium]
MKKSLVIILFLFSAGVFAQTLPNGNVEGVNVGNIAPEIIMKNPKDSSLALSSLRGKIVLLDFWASWCHPCRNENPYVVKAYKQYRDSSFVGGETFDVFSVSLDNPGGLTLWTNAIKADSLTWPCHVSDLQGWQNAAAQRYGIFQIPSNFLLDGNGVILAKDLQGDALSAALATMTDHVKNNAKMNAAKKKKKKSKKKKSTTSGFGSSFATLTETKELKELIS